jgi:glycosyltransferase involved in cell wall biosynthesis
VLKFSVIVSTYNRGALLDDALRGLSELDYPEYEVVVVNGPSLDNTDQVLEKWKGRIKVGKCGEANLSLSRNIGIQMAAGDVAAFIDDDAVPHPRWLSELAHHYGDPAVAGVGGFTIDNSGIHYQVKKTVCDRFGNALFPHDYFDERPLSFPGAPLYPSLLGTNSSFRLSALREIGGFDHVFAYFLDETDVCLRLIDRGRKIVYEPKALVYHQFAASHVRNKSRVPRTLYPSAISKSYFIHRHGGAFSEERANEELTLYKAEILRANKWMLDHGEISELHRVSLDDDLLFGIREGTRRAREKQMSVSHDIGDLDLSAPTSSFLPMAERGGLRIVLVSRAFPPANENGIARWTSMMARGLADRGHKVHVITHAAQKPFTRYERGFWVHAVAQDHSEEGRQMAARHAIPPDLGGWCYAVYKTFQSLKTFGVDVVSFPIWDVEGLLLADDKSVGVVMSLHTSYALARPFKPEWTERPLLAHFHIDRIVAAETRMLKQVAHILGNSKAIVRDIENAYSVRINEKTVIAPHGTFEPIGFSRTDVIGKAKEKRDGKPFRISYVGRFEARKGFNLACDAFRRILEQIPDAEIRMVGDSLNDSLRAEITTIGAEVLLADRRVSFRGALSRDDLDRIYFDSDMVLMPSRYESFGLVAIEAMASGTPVIALASGGLAEVVQDGETGFLTPSEAKDGGAIAEKIIRLYRDPELLRRMKETARDAFEAKFTVEQMTAAAEPVYLAAVRGLQ